MLALPLGPHDIPHLLVYLGLSLCHPERDGSMSLFKKFEPKPDLGPATALKSSVRRVIRQKLTDQYPALAKDEGALLEAAWPNKASVTTVKFPREHVQMLISDKQVLFFQHYDDWYLPSLRLLHKCKCFLLAPLPLYIGADIPSAPLQCLPECAMNSP